MSASLPIPLDSPLPLERVPTPALLVDEAALELNLRRMARHAETHDVGLRPHTKTHKCPILARRQLEAGAVGVCAAKVSEAEVLVEAGVDEVLITSPVATRDKVDRVVALADRAAGLRIVVDNLVSASLLDEVAREAGVIAGVLVDLDPGIRRTGVAPGKPALELVERISELAGLRFDGLQAYAGHVMHVEGWEKRRDRSRSALEACIETRHSIEAAGYEVPIFTGAGTGTFDIDPDLREFTDLQVGSYLFMDVEYRVAGGRGGDVFDDFEPALFVQATAISQPTPELITIDAGFKALATDTVKPQVVSPEGARYNWGGDEHGILSLQGESTALRVGDRVRILVPHCDPTVNLYDVYHPFRNGMVHELWPIAGRGKSQ